MTGYQVPRNSLAWMLIAQLAVIAPHVLRLPYWTTALCIACGIWRVMVYQGRWSYPGSWMKAFFVVAGIAGLALGYRSALGLDPWVGLLIMMFALKLLEMHSKKDGYVVILLAYFVALTQFLYDQAIPSTAYMFLCVVMITASLIGLNQTITHVRPMLTFRKASIILLQSLPLMIVLFVMFPRISPLWAVPLQQQIGKTGVTDVLKIGDIAQLTQSDELAFRASFEGDAPPLSELYWRGLVLSRFDGRTESWRQQPAGVYGEIYQAGGKTPEWAINLEYLDSPVSYSILMEPTNQNWLFSLSLPQAAENPDFGLVSDYRFFSLREVRSKLRYEVTSYLDYRAEVEMNDFWKLRHTLLWRGVNPRTQELARDMWQAADRDPQQFVGDVLEMYRQQNFYYTLKPPMLNANAIDGFLFETRSGFCEHYASSFTYLMRAAGIPARIVVGYQGGEYNSVGNYVEVRQFDAHAWSEIWLEGQGWIRVDPTSAVAPDRIARGLESAVDDEFLSDITLSWMKYKELAWLSELRFQISALSHYWNTFVVGYNPQMQMDLISRYFGDLDRKEMGMIMLGSFFGLLSIIGLFLLMKRTYRLLSPIDQEFQAFCHAMERQGLARNKGEGPLSFGSRIKEERPDLAQAAAPIIEKYVRANYVVDTPDDSKELRRLVRAFRLRRV